MKLQMTIDNTTYHGFKYMYIYTYHICWLVCGTYGRTGVIAKVMGGRCLVLESSQYLVPYNDHSWLFVFCLIYIGIYCILYIIHCIHILFPLFKLRAKGVILFCNRVIMTTNHLMKSIRHLVVKNKRQLATAITHTVVQQTLKAGTAHYLLQQLVSQLIWLFTR